MTKILTISKINNKEVKRISKELAMKTNKVFMVGSFKGGKKKPSPIHKKESKDFFDEQFIWEFAFTK